MDGWNMTAPAGSNYVIGYGGTLEIPTLEIPPTETQTASGTYVVNIQRQAELMSLAEGGKGHHAHPELPLTSAVEAFRGSRRGRVRGRAIPRPMITATD